MTIDSDSHNVTEDGAVSPRRPRSELRQVGERRVVRIGRLQVAGRRRRPVGEKEPLPREFKGSGIFWLLIALAGLLIWFMLFAVAGSPDWWTRQDLRLLLKLEDMRTDAATAFLKGVNLLTSDLTLRVLRWGIIIALVFYRRWRHLVAGMFVFLLVGTVSMGMEIAVARPRPLVEILVPWEGYSTPSLP